MGAKVLLKQLVPDVREMRTVKFGPSRGAKLGLSRRHEWAKELGLYEAELWPWYRRFIHPGSFVMDIGAGIGETSILFSRMVQPYGTVVAFEPNPETFARLEENIASSRASGVIARKDVFGTRAGLSLSDNPYDDFISTLSVDGYLQLLSGDQPANASFIKIDVDGSEMGVLLGARGTLAKYKTAWLVETHSNLLESNVRNLFTGYEYETSTISPAWWRCLGVREGRPRDNRWIAAWPR